MDCSRSTTHLRNLSYPYGIRIGSIDLSAVRLHGTVHRLLCSLDLTRTWHAVAWCNAAKRCPRNVVIAKLNISSFLLIALFDAAFVKAIEPWQTL